jgi:hypothetical protein
MLPTEQAASTCRHRQYGCSHSQAGTLCSIHRGILHRNKIAIILAHVFCCSAALVAAGMLCTAAVSQLVEVAVAMELWRVSTAPAPLHSMSADAVDLTAAEARA